MGSSHIYHIWIIGVSFFWSIVLLHGESIQEISKPTCSVANVVNGFHVRSPLSLFNKAKPKHLFLSNLPWEEICVLRITFEISTAQHTHSPRLPCFWLQKHGKTYKYMYQVVDATNVLRPPSDHNGKHLPSCV